MNPTTSPETEPQLTTLENGTRVLRVPMPGVKSVTVLAMVDAGRRYEPQEWAGISHFLEHMVFKGTASFANSQQLASEIDNVGGEFNAFTSKEYTGYYVKLASRYLDTALNVVSDMLCTPLLRQQDIDREVKVITEEINMYEDLPMRRIGDVYEDLLFAGSNLEGEVLGTKETIASLNHDDFAEYIHDWYGFNNVVFVVAGDETVVGSDDLVSKVEQYLQKGGQDRLAHEHQSFFKENVYGNGRKAVIHKDTEQAHFILGFPTFPRSNAKKHSLSVLSTLLGRTMSSRMFTQIRDNLGLCYYIRSGTDYYHDGGTFIASAGVDPNRINEALTATKQEFLKLHDSEPVTEQEIRGAKQNIIGSLLLQLEDSQSVAYWHGLKLLLEGQVQTTAEVVKFIEDVTPAQIQEIVEEVIDPDKMRLALIGPYQEDDINV